MPAVPCLIFVGGGDPDAAIAADRFFRHRRGWAVVSSFGVPENGAALLTGPWSTHLTEQTITFLRDYRTPPGNVRKRSAVPAALRGAHPHARSQASMPGNVGYM